MLKFSAQHSCKVKLNGVRAHKFLNAEIFYTESHEKSFIIPCACTGASDSWNFRTQSHGKSFVFPCDCTSVRHAENFRTQLHKVPLVFCAVARKKKNLNHHILSLILVDILSLNMLSVLKSFICGYMIKCFGEWLHAGEERMRLLFN